MGHGVYTTEKNMSNGIYFKMIMDISSKLGEDRRLNKITFEQERKLFNTIDQFWKELCKVDRENGIEVE
jgi:hypothetical protein